MILNLTRIAWVQHGVLGCSEDQDVVGGEATRSILAEMALERGDRAAAEAALAPTAAVESRLEGSHGWFWLPYAHAHLAFDSGNWQEALARFLEAGERLGAIRAGDEGVELPQEAVAELDGTEAELAPARARADLAAR